MAILCVREGKETRRDSSVVWQGVTWDERKGKAIAAHASSYKKGVLFVCILYDFVLEAKNIALTLRKKCKVDDLNK